MTRKHEWQYIDINNMIISISEQQVQTKRFNHEILPEEIEYTISHNDRKKEGFSDGIESDYLQFNSGIEATITVAEKRGHLVV